MRTEHQRPRKKWNRSDVYRGICAVAVSVGVGYVGLAAGASDAARIWAQVGAVLLINALVV